MGLISGTDHRQRDSLLRAAVVYWWYYFFFVETWIQFTIWAATHTTLVSGILGWLAPTLPAGCPIKHLFLAQLKREAVPDPLETLESFILL
jgi:hypothetical protein